MHHPAQRVARGEEHRLRLEVVRHRPVVVQMIVAKVGEDGHVEVDALHPRLHQRVARHLHGDRVPGTVGFLPVPHAGEHTLDLRRLGRRPRARERAHHVGRPTGRTEKVTQELRHGGLAVRPGHPDHQEVSCGERVEGRGQPGHAGAHRPRRDPRLHDVAVDQLGDEVLANEADRAALHRLCGMGVPVADEAGDATEQVPRHHPPAVVGDAADEDGGGVAHRLDHLDVVEEEVHGHGSHDRTDSVACSGHPCVTPAMGVWERVT